MKIKRIAALAALALACCAAGPTTAPSPDLSKDKTLYVVGYAHLDTQWRWAYPQVIREYIADTLNNNFALFEKYPHYVFNFSGSRRYEMMKEYYPKEYAKLKEYVAAGRWFPCGSSVDENDANVPSAESLVRQVLYGNHFFRREFGTASEEYMLPDCFGFPYALPSVLAHCGIRGFSTQKLTWGSAVGIPFKVGNWEGPDGRSVIAALDPGAYVGDVKDNLANDENWVKRVENNGAASGVFTDYHYFGTGDRGGAPKEATVAMVEKSVTTTDGKMNVVSGPADLMFKAITPEQAKNLPRYKGELLLTQHSAGSPTSEAYMKRWNRKNELLADSAERASVAAMLLGKAPYPSQKLYNAWDLLLGSQMHDMLPGTSMPRAYEFCWNDETLAANQFAAVATDAVGGITQSMDTRGQGVSLVVYNPLSIDRSDIVEATVPLNAKSLRVIAPDGQEVPAQIVSREGNDSHILFMAHVPSVGFATYDVRPSDQALAPSPELRVTESSLENSRYKVTLNTVGDVAGIFDKENKHELLSAPARLAFMHENPAQYPAWNMDWDDQKQPPYAYVDGPAKIQIIENGPARVALSVTRHAQGSTFTQIIRLPAGGASVEFDTHVDWRTRETALKAVFPMAVANENATYDLQVGKVERGNNNEKHYEVPQHQWIDLTAADKSYGVSILNDCKFGSDKPDDQTIRLTLIYTPGTRAGYRDQGTQDIGRHQMLYALNGHKSDWRDGDTAWRAARLNQPLASFIVPAHEGALGKQFSLLTNTSGQVMVSAIKKAEDSDEVIIRLRELYGTDAKDVRIQLPQQIISAREVDGQEREIGPATVQNGALVTGVNGYSLRAFALRLAPIAMTTSNTVVELPFNTDVVTTTANLKDGGFDHDGRTIAAEQLPDTITSEGIEFHVGPKEDGQKNAVTCRGQKINVSGGFEKAYILAAADGDSVGKFLVDGKAVDISIADWGGFVGAWDTRHWKGEVPEMGTNWQNEYDGLKPGFVRPDTVAWFSSHRHHPATGNEFYSYSYLFKYAIDLPKGAKTITLPKNDHIKIMAMTLARNPHDSARPARPLRDMLDDHTLGAPSITPASGQFVDATSVTIDPPLYWIDGGLRYTTDGTEPTINSPVYSHPITLAAAAVVRARMFYADGAPGPIAGAVLNIHDVTPPTVRSVSGIQILPQLRVDFSEGIDKSLAQNVANYHLVPDNTITSATLEPDGKSVILGLGSPLNAAQPAKLTITGIKDSSPAHNEMPTAEVAVQLTAPVYHAESIDTEKPQEIRVDGLPSHGSDSWTINLFVRCDKQPENRTLIAGFGHVDDQADGQSRYLAKFANGIHFWSRHNDVETKSKLHLNQWQMLTAAYDGHTLFLLQDGQLIGQRAMQFTDDESVVRIAPVDPWEKQRRFTGEIRNMTIWNNSLSPEALQTLMQSHP